MWRRTRADAAGKRCPQRIGRSSAGPAGLRKMRHLDLPRPIGKLLIAHARDKSLTLQRELDPIPLDGYSPTECAPTARAKHYSGPVKNQTHPPFSSNLLGLGRSRVSFLPLSHFYPLRANSNIL